MDDRMSEPLTVAYQGEPGAYSEEALLEAFPGGVSPVPRPSFTAVADAVVRGETALGLLPVENSLAGSVVDSYDLLARGDLTVAAELVHPIHHRLLGVPGARLAGVRRILSHPVALAQCTRFLASSDAWEAVAVRDTAGAARMVAEAGEEHQAAIAGRAAGHRYGLEVLAEEVQDRPDNRTRFFLVSLRGRSARLPSGLPRASRTAVSLEVEHRPGALMSVLEPFAREGIDLTRLESRPGGVPWRYRFFLELASDAEAPAAARALEEVRGRTTRLDVLGSFPRVSAAESGSGS